MNSNSRKSGIQAIGVVPWGSHFCAFYDTQEDLIDLLVPYFKAGLEDNEYCIWICSEPLRGVEAKGALESAAIDVDGYIEKGQLEILDHDRWCARSGTFKADPALQGWTEKEKDAVKRGASGLRIAGNTSWLAREEWETFADYEEKADHVIGNSRMLAMCAYSLERCGAQEIMDAVSNHLFALARRGGRWTMIKSSRLTKMEEEARHSEQRFRALIENSMDGIALLDAAGSILLFPSAATARIVGFELDELVGRSVFDLIHPDDVPQIAKRWRELLQKPGQNEMAQFRFRHKDGSWRWLEAISRNLLAEPSVQALVVNYRDISERKQAEEVQRRSVTYVRSLIEANLDVVVAISVGGKITDVNEAMVQATGLPREKLIGADFSDIFTEPEKAREGLRRVFSEGFVRDYPLAIRHVSSRVTDVTYNATVYRDEQGHALGVLATARDVTDRKRADEALRELSRRLRQSRDEERRRIARELHDSAAQTLAAVTMKLGVLAREVASNQRWGGKAVKLLNDSLTLVEDCSHEVRTLSYVLHPPLLDQLGLSSALRSFVEGFARCSGIQISLEVPEDLGRLPAEVELTVFSIVQESLANIHRHSGSRTAGIRLALESGRVTLEVSDQGCGVAEQHLQAIKHGTARPGLGFPEMRERLSYVGGEMKIKSNAQGTTICAVIDLTRGGL